MPFGSFLGYERGDDGQPKIVEKEARIVRKIYRMFLDGKTPTYIAKYLTEQNIPTPRDKDIWRSTTVESILKNEKYKGAALLQKTFTTDFLTKKKKQKEGEIPQYYVEDSALVNNENVQNRQLKMYNYGNQLSNRVYSIDENIYEKSLRSSRLRLSFCSEVVNICKLFLLYNH